MFKSSDTSFYFIWVSVDVHSLHKQGSDYMLREQQVIHPPQFGTVTKTWCDFSMTMIRGHVFATAM